MPVLSPPFLDPTDLVLQGEQLRSVAVALVVMPPSLLALDPLPDSVPMVADDEDVLSMIGADTTGTPGGLSPRLSPAPFVSVNGVICTPCGAIIPLDRLALWAYPTQATDRWFLTGVTRSGTGAALPGCRVLVLETGRLSVGQCPVITEGVSDGSGNYSLEVPSNQAYQVLAYLAGSPDVAGVTRSDVTPVAG